MFVCLCACVCVKERKDFKLQTNTHINNYLKHIYVTNLQKYYKIIDVNIYTRNHFTRSSQFITSVLCHTNIHFVINILNIYFFKIVLGWRESVEERW